MPSTKSDHGPLLDALTPIVTSAGFDLEDLTVANVGRRNILRLVIDSDHGVDLDEVASVSRAVSEALDGEHAGVLEGSYQLEVSSPGVDRPLTEPRHWRRAVGLLVNVSVDAAPITGRVLAAGPDGVTLSVDGRAREVAWPALGAGKIQIEFNRIGDLEQDDAAEEG